MDELVEKWWNSVNTSYVFSGALTGFKWDELWPEAQEDLRKVYEAVVESQRQL